MRGGWDVGRILDANKNSPGSDVLVSNESLVKYENDVKTGKSNVEDKTDDQCYSKGEDLKNARSETLDKLNSKSQPEAHDNVVLENETPTIDAGTDDMVSGYLNLTDDEVQNFDEGEVNEVQQSEKMICEVNQNGNDLTVARQEVLQMKANPTTITTDGNARSYEFPKVKLEVTDSSIGKMLELASPMSLINPLTTNAGQHSGEASENIFAMDDEGSPEDQAAFLGKLGTFYREKVMEFKPPRFYGHHLNCLKLWKYVITLGGYDQLLLKYERHRTKNGELQLPIDPSPGSSDVDNEEQHLLGYGEVAEPIVKDMSAYNTPNRVKSLKTTGSLKHQGQNEAGHPIKAVEHLSDVKINCFPSARLDVQVVDVGPPVDWVKINVRETVVTLPARIDQLRTNVVASLHGCLHVHVPFAQQNL
ncbi:hypothetical protein MTR67_051741 [Solanum verrucosum]|uniref:ARID domain-containing protein n=1 Tax=Solanum verrucosum TaxID=315347 RepID=A0AAF0V7X2_SOLVR|nr:hypothetical protein MTR67_051741 [Solanum verrucosum]